MDESSPLKTHSFRDDFITECGQTIAKPTLAYRQWGTLNAARDNIVVVFHALTGNSKAREWFGGFFEHSVLNPDHQCIICCNVPGSCYGSSGPTHTNPATGRLYRADFPQVSIRDMVRMQQQLMDDLDVAGIELVMGGSMGGMQALEFALVDDRPRAAVCIGMGKAHAPWTIGISHTQRQAIYNDPNWKEGYYTSDAPPTNGLTLARMIAMNSYRAPADFDEKFGRRENEKGQFEVESYLNYQGKKLAQRFDAASYVRLTQAMDSHDIARSRGSYKEVLSALTVPLLAIGIDSDGLYPPSLQRELANLAANGRYAEIHSRYGHDAFLIEFEQMAKLINPFLKSIYSPV